MWKASHTSSEILIPMVALIYTLLSLIIFCIDGAFGSFHFCVKVVLEHGHVYRNQRCTASVEKPVPFDGDTFSSHLPISFFVMETPGEGMSVCFPLDHSDGSLPGCLGKRKRLSFEVGWVISLESLRGPPLNSHNVNYIV